MQIPHDPDRWMAEVESHTCRFHQRNPGKSFAGCTCSGKIGAHAPTLEEYRETRMARLRNRAFALRQELNAVTAELAALEDDPNE